MNASTPAAPGRPTAGIDWASDDHAVAVVDLAGAVVTRCTVEHTGAGLRALVTALQRADVDAVGIERPTSNTLLTPDDVGSSIPEYGPRLAAAG